MEDPAHEIARVINLLTNAANPEIQKAAFEKYVASDVEFLHPVCMVPSGPNSRDRLLGVYQWYRIMSPTNNVAVKHTTFDEHEHVLYLDVTQTFHIRISPFAPALCRLLVRVTLRKKDEQSLWVIAIQEDFYHPDQFMTLLVPLLAPLVRIFLFWAALASNIYAKLGQSLGLWRTEANTRAEWRARETPFN